MTNTVQKDMNDLQEKVTAKHGLTDSAVALIHGLAEEIEKAKNDPATIQSVVDRLRASSAELSAAIFVGSTPAEVKKAEEEAEKKKAVDKLHLKEPHPLEPKTIEERRIEDARKAEEKKNLNAQKNEEKNR